MKYPRKLSLARRFTLIIPSLALLSACASSPAFHPGTASDTLPPWPKVSFAVLSDVHLFPDSLWSDGQAFQAYLAKDRKLLPESEQALALALDRIAAARPDFLLVSGDLTKDGELVSHQTLAKALDGLAAKGIRSWVIPGNHDIDNPHAQRFDGARSSPVDSVSPADFARIYDRHGYGDALERDPASLSWLAEPVPGLWLIGVDSNRYAQNRVRGEPETAGGLDARRMAWLEQVLRRGRDAGKAMIMTMHHGLVEHYQGQKQHFGEYVIDNHASIADMAAFYGVQLCFTGHYHANDVTRRAGSRGGEVYDIETGSLVTWPQPWRLVSLEGRTASIRTFRLDDAFPAGHETISKGIGGIAAQTMQNLGMSADESARIANLVAPAFMAHYAGDEPGFTSERFDPGQTSLMGFIVLSSRRSLIEALWNDLAPVDNDLEIPRK